jgi:hypothetical protein
MSKGETPMRKLLLALAVLALSNSSLAIQLARGDDEKAKHPEPSVFMKQKLSATQNVLAGLTKGDFDAIRKNAESMVVVGYFEKWVRADTPGYQMLMEDFMSANKSLISAAHAKNLDGATIAYVQLTFSCVNCHKIVRGDVK